jgi:hypothetical protein
MNDLELAKELEFEVYGNEFFEQMEKQKKAMAMDSQLLTDYEMTFQTDHGQRVLHDIMVRGMVFQTTFTGNAWSNFKEGIRWLALYIMQASKRNRHLKQKEE